MALSLKRWNPLRALASRLGHEEVEASVNDEGKIVYEWRPRSEITETDDAIVVRAELPGVTQEDIHVELDGSILRIRGEKKWERTEEEGGRALSERFYGSFERTFPLPAEVSADEIEATLKAGVLEVRIPRQEPAEEAARRIPIQQG